MKDADEAENIVQESFIKLCEIRERLNPEKDTEAYLLKIIRNKSFDYFKRQEKNHALHTELKGNTWEPNFVQVLPEENPGISMESLMHLLPSRRRRIISLIIEQGKSHYYVENENQILSISSPASSGYTSRMVNAGLLASRGWELSLGGTPLRNSNGWNLDLNVNFTRNRTTVEALADGLEFITLWDDNGGGSFTKVGEEIGNLYRRGYAYVKDPNSPYYKWPILDNSAEWISVNDRDAREKVDNFNPDFLMGMQATLSYKRFTLSASFDWRAGGEFQSYTYRYGESDWKSQRQIDNLIAGGLYSEQELIALLKSDPEKYIIPQNGNFPRVGGYTQETGGYPVMMRMMGHLFLAWWKYLMVYMKNIWVDLIPTSIPYPICMPGASTNRLLSMLLLLSCEKFLLDMIFPGSWACATPISLCSAGILCSGQPLK